MPVTVDQVALEALVSAPGYQVVELALEQLVVPPAFQVADMQLEFLVQLPLRVPNLRQRQRDDDVRVRSVGNSPRSKQGSIRAGWRGTYL